MTKKYAPLVMQPNGRFTLGDAELSCGSCVDVLIGGQWIAGRVEHDGDYFLLIPDHDNPDCFTKLRLAGLRARFTNSDRPRSLARLAVEMLEALELAYRSARIVHGADSELCVRLENTIAKAKGRASCPHNWLCGYCDLCGAVKGETL